MKIQNKIPFFIIGISWTVFILSIYFYLTGTLYEHAVNAALSQARGSFEKDIILKKWVSSLGGIYAPVSDRLSPNPYLKLPKRDIVSNFGDNLTLLNPAYVNRLLYDFQVGHYGKTRNHITSLDPVNPENKPYDWEIEPLKKFEKGEKEFFEVQEIEGRKLFIYMAPLYTAESCLKCHEETGYKVSGKTYKVGDLRGGISTTLDFEPFLSEATTEHGHIQYLYLAVGLLGLTGFFLFYKHIEKNSRDLFTEKEKFKVIFDNSPTAIFFYDNFGNILELNLKLEDVAGADEDKIKKINLFKLDNKEFQSAIEKSLSEGSGYFNGWYTTMAGGKKIYLEAIFTGIKNAHGFYDRGLGVFNDNTEVVEKSKELENAQNQMIQMQKLESIGRLAGGVAHDFNNILTVILSYAELADGETTENSLSKKYLKQIINAVGKASKMTQQLLIFSRKKVLKNEITSPNELLKNFHKMLKRLVPENIEINLDLRDGVKNIFVDTGQIEQAIMNLVVNAKDAMPEGGSIIIETDNVYLDESYMDKHMGSKPGEYVMISISDTGFGMEKDLMEHIFEPFFTTKEIGKGTGMGLAVVYSVVKQSGGNIYVYSEPGMGTTFKIYLPVSKFAPEDKKTVNEESEIVSYKNGEYKILLVEDETEIGNVFKDILSSKGFDVLYVNEPLKALEIVKNGHFIPDILITDVIMPKLNGVALLEQIKRIIPGLKYFVMSGYPDDILRKQGYDVSEKELLRKPVKISELLKRLEDIIKTFQKAT